jgi:uncharacterized membrane protein YfcA
MEITWMSGLGLVAFGLIVGTYGTMVGAGGGFLIVPVLLLVWHLPPALAAGTSLAVVFLNAAAGSTSYARQGRVDYKSGILLALPTLPGSIAGAFIADRISGRVFHVIFAVLLLTVASLLLWKPVGRGEEPTVRHEFDPNGPWWRMQRVVIDKTGHEFRYQYNLIYGLLISFGVGFMSSILGIGGGIVHVPALIHLLGFPSHLAAATSHFILAISALVGAGTHVALGNVLFIPAGLMGVGVIVGAYFGAKLAHKSKGAVTVRLLSIALIVVAIRLLLK